MCSLLVLLIAVAIGGYLYTLPENDNGNIDKYIVTKSKIVESHLSKHKGIIGDDYNGYRGHIYRVLSYTLYKLQGKDDKRQRELIEVALVYHDIGLWSDKDLNYLEPSIEFMKKNIGNKYDEREVNLMTDIIRYHHKFTSFDINSMNKDAIYVDTVNAVRESDLTDFSLGIVTNGVSRGNIKKVMDKIPNDGFHKTLLMIGPRYYGYNVFKIVYDLGQIFYL